MRSSELLSGLKIELIVGSLPDEISKMVPLDELSEESEISWCSSKFKDTLVKLQRGCVLLADELLVDFQPPPELVCIVVKQPRRAFQLVATKFFDATAPEMNSIAKTARISERAVIGENCTIGENVVIEGNCVIGNNVSIGHNTVLHSRTKVGDLVQIGCNCTIGGVGFGYERNDQGAWELIPHLGEVILEERCEIGNNVCIDRAAIGSTRIESGVKVDNLVHIAHGVKIGKNSLIIANSMIAGSVKIGENCWVAPTTSILNHLKIGDNSLIGMGSVVLKDVRNGELVAGVPARKLRDI